MDSSLQRLLILVAVLMPLFFICACLSEKFKIKNQQAIAALLAVVLIVSGIFSLSTGEMGYAWGVSLIPLWGYWVFVIIGIIIIIMLICHWRQQKKNPVLPSDEDTDAQTTQDSLSTEDNAHNPSDDKDKS